MARVDVFMGSPALDSFSPLSHSVHERRTGPAIEYASSDSDCEFLALSEDDEGTPPLGPPFAPATRHRDSRTHATQAPVSRARWPLPLSVSGTLGLPVAMTTSAFLRDVLDARISLVDSLRAGDSGGLDVVIPQAELRALLAKALVWFADRECLEDIGQSQIVLVGRERGQPVQPFSPASSMRDLRIIAEDLPDTLTIQQDGGGFDDYMFHAGKYFSPRSHFPIVLHASINVFLVAVVVYLLSHTIPFRV